MPQMCPKCSRDNRDGAKYCAYCWTEEKDGSRKGTELRGLLGRGTVLEGRYRIDRVLGAGGFGAAYLAWDVRLNRACVVKHMLIPTKASQQEINDLQRTFEREADSLVSLNQPGHPNIPEIYDFFFEPSGNYLVMKYIEGENLEDRLARLGGRLAWPEAVKFVIQVCDALTYMHSRQPDPVLHRDIKPANILVDATGRVWLVDFGLSKAQPATGGVAGKTTSAGTPGYTPLEQWLKQAVPASDVYALGATLHHLVTGIDPRDPFLATITFDLALIRQHHGQFVPLQQVDSCLPNELGAALDKALQQDVHQRCTAAQFRQVLERILAPKGTAQPFAFRSGDMARTMAELVSLCDRHWAEARGYLYKGNFASWFRSLNRHDLATQAEAIRQRGGDQDTGLEEMLHVLDPQLPHPVLSVNPKTLDFGTVSSGQKKQKQFTVQNAGRGYVRVEMQLRPQQPWLAVQPAEARLLAGQAQQVKVTVDAGRLPTRTCSTGEITVTSALGAHQVRVGASLSLWKTVWARYWGAIVTGLVIAVILAGIYLHTVIKAKPASLTVSVLENNIWRTYVLDNAGLAGGGTWAIALDTQGHTWVGTTGGVNVFDGDSWGVYTMGNSDLASNNIRALAIDDRSRIWAGTPNGLMVFDGHSWGVYTAGNFGLASNDIRALAIDDRGRVWAGTSNGLMVFDGHSWGVYTMSNSDLASNDIRALAIDDRGRVWAGTPNGLMVFDGHSWGVYTMSNSDLASNDIRALAIDDRSRVWAGTPNGLMAFDGHSWGVYTAGNSSLADNDIRTLAVDSRSRLWVGH